jgi:hypothetical protein
MIGKNKIKDWRACVRTWEKSENKPRSGYIGATYQQTNFNKEDF